MEDKEFICVWNDSLKDSIKEFTKEFREITSEDDKEGIYTFFFSRFSLEEHKLVTDVLYSFIFQNTFLFLWPYSNSMVLDLDDMLNVTDGINAHVDNNIMGEICETPNIDYIGDIVSSRGHGFGVFTLNEMSGKILGIQLYEEIFENHVIDMEDVIVSNDDIIEVSLEYLNYKIENLQEIVDKSIDEDEADPRLVENPYADRFYDKDDAPQPLNTKRMLGDSNI